MGFHKDKYNLLLIKRSDQLVIDVDDSKLASHLLQQLRLPENKDLRPALPVVQTPSGGLHLIYKLPGNCIDSSERTKAYKYIKDDLKTLFSRKKECDLKIDLLFTPLKGQGHGRFIPGSYYHEYDAVSKELTESESCPLSEDPVSLESLRKFSKIAQKFFKINLGEQRELTPSVKKKESETKKVNGENWVLDKLRDDLPNEGDRNNEGFKRGGFLGENYKDEKELNEGKEIIIKSLTASGLSHKEAAECVSNGIKEGEKRREAKNKKESKERGSSKKKANKKKKKGRPKKKVYNSDKNRDVFFEGREDGSIVIKGAFSLSELSDSKKIELCETVSKYKYYKDSKLKQFFRLKKSENEKDVDKTKNEDKSNGESGDKKEGENFGNSEKQIEAGDSNNNKDRPESGVLSGEDFDNIEIVNNENGLLDPKEVIIGEISRSVASRCLFSFSDGTIGPSPINQLSRFERDLRLLFTPSSNGFIKEINIMGETYLSLRNKYLKKWREKPVCCCKDLSVFFNVKDSDHLYYKNYFLRLFSGMLEKGLNIESKFEFIHYLVGDTRIGKDTIVDLLAPPPLKNLEDVILPVSKYEFLKEQRVDKIFESTNGSFIAFDNEDKDGKKKVSANTLKALVSRERFKARFAWEKKPSLVYNRAIYMAALNPDNTGFLSQDPSGHNRDRVFVCNSKEPKLSESESRNHYRKVKPFMEEIMSNGLSRHINMWCEVLDYREKVLNGEVKVNEKGETEIYVGNLKKGHVLVKNPVEIPDCEMDYAANLAKQYIYKDDVSEVLVEELDYYLENQILLLQLALECDCITVDEKEVEKNIGVEKLNEIINSKYIVPSHLPFLKNVKRPDQQNESLTLIDKALGSRQYQGERLLVNMERNNVGSKEPDSVNVQNMRKALKAIEARSTTKRVPYVECEVDKSNKKVESINIVTSKQFRAWELNKPIYDYLCDKNPRSEECDYLEALKKEHTKNCKERRKSNDKKKKEKAEELKRDGKKFTGQPTRCANGLFENQNKQQK